MVETDIGDYGEHRSYDVGTIQSSAQADFDDSYIYAFIGEILKGHRRCNLEKGRMEWLKEGLFLLYETNDIVFAYGNSVDADTFAEIHQMR